MSALVITLTFTFTVGRGLAGAVLEAAGGTGAGPGAAVLAYTAVHGLAFILFGIVGALLIAGAERQPMLIFALVILFTSFEIFFFGLVLIAASWILDEVAGWTIFVGNVLAAAAMLAYYFRRHRTLAGRLMAEAVAGTAERFDVLARRPPAPFPGGPWLRHPGAVLSRDQLLDAAWPYGVAVTPNTVDAYVHMLREKLGPEGAARIRTERGVGYRMPDP